MKDTLCMYTLEGRSFPRFIQWLSTLLVLGMVVSAWVVRDSLMQWTQVPELVWLGVGSALVVAWGYGNILFSKTSLGPDGLVQGWLIRTSVPLKDITRVKFLRIRGLDWLLAPRLVAKTSLGGSITFWSADPCVLAQMDRFVFGAEHTGESNPSSIQTDPDLAKTQSA